MQASLFFPILKKKLVLAYKFLSFQEDVPKHFVVGSSESAILLIILMFPAVAGMITFILNVFVYYGFLGGVVAYIVSTVLVIEVPHIIMDR